MKRQSLGKPKKVVVGMVVGLGEELKLQARVVIVMGTLHAFTTEWAHNVDITPEEAEKRSLKYLADAVVEFLGPKIKESKSKEVDNKLLTDMAPLQPIVDRVTAALRKESLIEVSRDLVSDAIAMYCHNYICISGDLRKNHARKKLSDLRKCWCACCQVRLKLEPETIEDDLENSLSA